MIDILPLNSRLDDISEQSGFSVEFSYRVTPPDSDTKIDVTEFKITQYDPNIGVIVSETTISGEYIDSFTLGSNSIKYITKDLIKKTAGSFNDLPDPTTADLYSFTAPTNLQKTYTYTVTAKYIVTVSQSGGDSGGKRETNKPSISEHTISKTYTQRVFGNWDVWAKQLRDYVKRGV